MPILDSCLRFMISRVKMTCSRFTAEWLENNWFCIHSCPMINSIFCYSISGGKVLLRTRIPTEAFHMSPFVGKITNNLIRNWLPKLLWQSLSIPSNLWVDLRRLYGVLVPLQGKYFADKMLRGQVDMVVYCESCD